MDYVLKQMERAIILSSEDIARFRKYIMKKYADFASDYRAEVLADCLYHVLDRHLEGVEESQRTILKKSLFKNTLARQKKEISKRDVFTEILSLEITANEICVNALRWVNKNVNTAVTLDDIRGYVAQTKAVRTVEFSEKRQRAPIRASISKTVTTQEDFLKKIEIIVDEIVEKQRVLKAEQQIHVSMGRKIIYLSRMVKVLFRRFQKIILPTAIAVALIVLTFLIGLVVTERVVDALLYKEVTERQNAAFDLVEKQRQLQNAGSFVYETFDVQKLRTHLEKANSKLADAPYFEIIIKTAKAHNIDPRLLFAIAGQEQSLVKKSNNFAEKIANNPFNVYGSWQEYNTDIADSSEIVCNTVVNRLAKKPRQADPLVWLNKTYAADVNWNKGVRSYFDKFYEASK